MMTTMIGVTRGPFWALLCAACLFGCGGRVGAESLGNEENDAGTVDDSANDSTSGTSKPGSTVLGKCHPGLPPDASLHTCPWLAKGLCYETKVEACACICPANRQDSSCSSGFPDGLYGQVEVKCY